VYSNSNSNANSPPSHTLSDIEIVEMVLEDAQIEAGVNIDSDEELPPPIVTIKEIYEALKKLIIFKEQQNEINDSMDKLKIFRKYLPHYEKLIDKSKIQPKLIVILLRTIILIILAIIILIISLTLMVM
jgi:hypothetical protein